MSISSRSGKTRPRVIQFKVMVNEMERNMIQELAELDGVSLSDIVRGFIRREHATKMAEQVKR